MTFKIKLKAGFFKTLPYSLSIRAEQIILTPQNKDIRKRIVIKNNDLQSIIITRKYLVSGEFEITANNSIYIGSFAVYDDIEQAAKIIAQEFRGKLSFLEKDN